MHRGDDGVDAMPQKCGIVGCANRSDNKERWVVMPHVTELSFHSCQNPEHLSIWTELISGANKKRKGVSGHTKVCSNHFLLGQPSPDCPFPLLYLRGYDEDVGQSILRDTMNTDHDYPKTRYCEEGEEKLGNMLNVSCVEEVEVRAAKHLSEDTASTWACCVKGSVGGHKEGKVNRPMVREADPVSTSSAKHQTTFVDGDNSEQHWAKGLQVTLPLAAPGDPVSSRLTENSATAAERKPFSTRKRSNVYRDTDHIYNTRKSKRVKETLVRKTRDRETDHLYNSRRTELIEDSFVVGQNNRDTDHIYNIPKTKLYEVNSSTIARQVSDTKSAERSGQETSITVDKRVVDKDHMYQHSVRKNRNKSENKNAEMRNDSCHPCAQTKKLLKPKGTDMGHMHEDVQIKKTSTKSENSVLHNKMIVSESVNRAGTCVTRYGRKAAKESERKQKKGALSRDLVETVEDAAAEYEPTTTSTHTVTASPVPSDNGSDHMCEDDSRRTGVWRTDHMYVHLDTDILEREGQSALTPCFSIEGYKEEHSYANSEEIHYDACVNCSELVQQLIGTIRQQGDHIDDLKKKLRAANARNKQLTSLFSHKSESLDC